MTDDFISSTKQSHTRLTLKTQVKSWKFDRNTNLFQIKILDLESNEVKTLTCKNLVLAVDGKTIKIWKKSLEYINPKILTTINAVSSQPLLRTYAIYNSKWFRKYGKIVTDGLVKFIIPIDYKLGLIMISYTDGEYVRKMMRHVKMAHKKKQYIKV